MILTGDEIIYQQSQGNILIDPFKPEHVGPNSIDLMLSPHMARYIRGGLDMKEDNPISRFEIDEEDGFRMVPGNIYLAMTNEKCGSDHFVTCVEGRSSVGRLGISVHQTAGFGDLGFKSNWTLEITVVQPVVIYPNVRICQAVFYNTYGYIGDRLYKGKYQDQPLPTPSGMWKDFLVKEKPTK